MNTKNILVAFGLLVVLALGVSFPKGQSIVQKSVGAISTLDGVDYPFVSIGGVREWHGKQSLTATSSTICSIKNPLAATSTIVEFSLNATSGILGGATMSLSTSTGSYATSSTFLALDHSVATNVGDTFMWTNGATSTTARVLFPFAADGRVNAIILPGEYLNLRLATTTGAGALASYYVGSCSAVFRAM